MIINKWVNRLKKKNDMDYKTRRNYFLYKQKYFITNTIYIFFFKYFIKTFFYKI